MPRDGASTLRQLLCSPVPELLCLEKAARGAETCSSNPARAEAFTAEPQIWGGLHLLGCAVSADATGFCKDPLWNENWPQGSG